MTPHLRRNTLRFAASLMSLVLLNAAAFATAAAQTTVSAVSPTGTISTTNTSETVPVNITRTDATAMLGFSVNITLSSELSLPSGTSSISLGGFLSASGASPSLQIIDHGLGNYTVDGVTLGLPCGSTASSGTLFNIDVSSANPSGTGTVTINSVTLRDCSNATLASSIGTAASVGIDNTLPSVAVTSPNGAEFWVVGSSQNITWTATDAAGIDAAGIDLEYSANNGGSWTSIVTGLANSGTYAWTVPNDPSATALVRATARDVNGNPAQDASDAVFTIGYYIITVNQGANGVIAPSGPVNVVYDGTQAFTITPSAGYHTTDVLVDAVSQGVLTGYTFNNVVANHTITATFAQNQLSIDDVPVGEAAGTAQFTVSLDAPVPAGQTVTVDYVTNDVSAVAPGDYTAITSTTLTFLAGESSKFVNVTINQDLIDEADETFTVDLSTPSNAVISDAQGVGTITDDDAEPTVTLSVSAATLLEDGSDSPATLTATLSNPTTAAITVDLGFTGTATLTDDYTQSGTQIVIPALSLSNTSTVSAVQDLIDEADETVIVDISTVSAGASESGTQQVTVTITDDDAEPTVTLSVSAATLLEDGSDSPATLTATLSGATTAAITVDLGFTGTATLTDDYTRSGTQIVIPALSLSSTSTVSAVQDLIDEADETVIADISAVSAGASESGTQQVTVTITDDDAEPTVTLSVSAATLLEDGSDSPATLTATLSGATTAAITVDLGFTGTATLTDDYTRSGTQIVIPALSLSSTSTVSAVQDLIDEADETVIADISAVSAGASESGTQQVTVTITDDDAEPTVTLSVSAATLLEDGSDSPATLTATLSGATTAAITVDLGFTGTATLTDDYTRSGTQIVIPALSLSNTSTVSAVQDLIDEADETVIVDISTVSAGASESGTQQVTVTITDDDAEPTVTLSVSAATLLEDGSDSPATLTATLSNPTTAAITVDLGFTGTATLTDDYTQSGTQIVIPALSLSNTSTVSAVQDLIDEADETVIVDISTVSAGASESGTQQVTVTITDDDAEPTVTLSVSAATLLEDGSDSPATLTATLSNPTTAAITVDLGFTGTATLTDDYTQSGTQIVIPALSLSNTSTVSAVQDLIDEADETVIVDISTVSAGASESGTQQVTVTITDDDAEPTVTLSVSAATLLEDGSDSPATLTATLSNPTTAAITVDLGFTGTATLTDDYTQSGTQIVIPALSLSSTSTVSAVQDLIDEADETVIVDISTVSAGASESGTQQVTVTITDDDGTPTLSINDEPVTEGNTGTVNANFTVTLSAASGLTVTVDYSTSDVSATAPGDYTAITTTQLTFNPGVTTQPVTVVVNGDAASEGDETFTVDLVNAANATIADAQGVGTILNDDAFADLAAAQQITGNDGDPTTKIQLTFTAPAGAAAVEVYRAGYGNYPEYDDNGGAPPTPPTSYPPSAPWVLTAVTATGQTDEVTTRDFYYYVAFSQNGAAVWSPPSNMTTGTLNYHLGDVSNGTTAGQGNDVVTTADISLLGGNYGVSLGASDPVGYLDVGPTTDLSVNARPTTDNVVNFEDLVMFAINYGVVSGPAAAATPTVEEGASNELVLHAPESVAAGGEVEVRLSLQGNGLVQALAVGLNWDHAVVEPIGVATGDLVTEQNGIVLSAKPGTMDAALFGRNRVGFTGEGTVATMRFRVLAEGNPNFGIESIDARDGSNRKVSINASMGLIPRPVPLVTSLSGAMPNPFRGTTAIVFGLAQGGQVELSLFSVDGRRVRTLVRGFQQAGEYRMQWDGRDDSGRSLSPGAYFMRLVTPAAQFTRKLTFLR